MSSPASPMIKYRKDAKKGIKFTIMICGESGTGKTTFINSLLDKKVMYHRYEETPEIFDTKTLTFTSITSSLPTNSILQKEFNPQTSNEEPGIALTETNVEIIDEDNIKLLLSIIDTPGFGDNLNNEVCFLEIENYLKQQFDLVLAEETRIKRNPRFTDSRVHVLLYFITPTGHGLREIDVACMKRLSKYVNIIPVIGKADAFTEFELKNFKKNIMKDIEKYNVPIFQFNFDEDEEDEESIEEIKFLQKIQPFAIISSEESFEIDGEIIRARQYPWGFIDINNAKFSDFPILKSVLLGSHLQDLKDLTHDFLYETYRTERLTKVTGDKNFDDNLMSSNYDTAEPSLSNLADLAIDDDSFHSELQQLNSPSILRNKKSMLLDNDAQSLASGNSTFTRPRAGFNDNGSVQSFNNSPRSGIVSEDDDNSSDIGTINQSKKKPPVIGSRTASSTSLNSNNVAFKRYSIAPQRNQLRALSETVPYVIRHERILERQQKLEEMEAQTAKELSLRAALLEKRAAELKTREKSLMKEKNSVSLPNGVNYRQSVQSSVYDNFDDTASSLNDEINVNGHEIYQDSERELSGQDFRKH